MNNGKVTFKKSDLYSCDIAVFHDYDCVLDSGYKLNDFQIAYQTYGQLNEQNSNAILICHALNRRSICRTKTSYHKKRWLVGTYSRAWHKPIDTNKYFIISSNVIGGCIGSTGPKEINPKTNAPYGLEFPAITIKDMVKIQAIPYQMLYKINKVVCCCTGGSMGAMQVLQWVIDYPEKILNAIHIAGALKHSHTKYCFSRSRQAS